MCHTEPGFYLRCLASPPSPAVCSKAFHCQRFPCSTTAGQAYVGEVGKGAGCGSGSPCSSSVRKGVGSQVPCKHFNRTLAHKQQGVFSREMSTVAR